MSMKTYIITATAEGDAVLTVEAESEDEAREVAYRDHLVGFNIGCGVASWEITNVEEVEDAQ